jgi:hypothetical protein
MIRCWSRWKAASLDFAWPPLPNWGICTFTPTTKERELGVIWWGKWSNRGIRCDGNPFSGRVLKKRGWVHVGPHRKERDGVVFENAWYELPAITPG